MKLRKLCIKGELYAKTAFEFGQQAVDQISWLEHRKAPRLCNTLLRKAIDMYLRKHRLHNLNTARA